MKLPNEVIKYILCLLILILNFNLKAQSIIGSVLDHNNKHLKDIKVISGKDSTLTDSLGKFRIDVRNLIDYQKLVFKKKNVVILEKIIQIQSNTEINLGNIVLPVYLKEVVINSPSKSIEMRGDRTVLYLNGDIGKLVTNAITAFQFIPNIIIQQNSIVSFGKGGVDVYLDSRALNLQGEDLLQFLNNFASEDIEKIEYFNSPPASFYSSSTGGAINIITKKKTNRYSIRNSHKKAGFYRTDLGGTLSYSKNKFSITTSIDYSNGYSKLLEEGQVLFSGGEWSFSDSIKRKINSFNSRISADYLVGAKGTLGFNYIGKISKSPVTDLNETSIDQSFPVISYGNTKQSDNHNSLNLNYRLTFGKDKNSWITNIDFFDLSSHKTRSIEGETNNSDILTKNNLVISNYSIKSDIVLPKNIGGVESSSGIKYTKTQTRNENELNRVKDEINNRKFDYNEAIFAAYADFVKNLKSIQFKAGIRFENFYTESRSSLEPNFIRNRYNILLPSFNINFDLGKNNSISFTASRKIRRPNFSELDPFRWYINPNFYSEGNPFLKHSLSNNLEISYRRRTNFNASIYYIKVFDGTSQIPIANSNDRTIAYVRENYFDNKMIGANIGYRPKLWKRWDSNNSLNIFYNQTSIKQDFNFIIPMNGFGSRLTSTNTVSLDNKKTFSLALIAWYMSPSKTVLYRNSSTYNISMTVNKSLIENKLNLTLAFSDIFKSSVPRNQTVTNLVWQQYYIYNDSRSLSLNIRYTFGNKKIKEIESSQGNETEIRRSN